MTLKNTLAHLLDGPDSYENPPKEMSLLIFKNQKDFKTYSGGYPTYTAHALATKRAAADLSEKYPEALIGIVSFDELNYLTWLKDNPGSSPAFWAATQQPSLWRLGLQIGRLNTDDAFMGIGWSAVSLQTEKSTESK